MEQTKIPASATAYRRQRQIEDCLYENLLLRPYSSVSVSDLCHQLGLSRKSFYNYYPDKDTCFQAIAKRKIQSCMLHLTSSSNAQEAAIAYLSYCREERAFCEIVARNRLTMTLMDQAIRYLQEEDTLIQELLNTDVLKNDPYVLVGFVSLNITFILQWHMENYATPVEEMARKYMRLLLEPLIVPKSKNNT